MPYNPSQNYVGGQLLASGIGDMGKGIGGGISAALEQYQKAQKEHEGDQMVIDYALKYNMLTPEQHTQYLNGSRSQKNDVVAGLTRTFAMDMQRQHEARLQQNADLQRRKGESELAFEPERQRLEGNLLKGRAAAAYSDAGGPGGTPGIDAVPKLTVLKDENGKPVVRVVTMPGSRAFQTVPVGGDIKLQTPEGTDQQFYLDSKGNPHPLKKGDPIAEEIAKMMSGGTAEAKPSPTPSGVVQPGEAGAAMRSQGQNVPVRVSSVEEAMALPKGTVFVDPQGVLRRR